MSPGGGDTARILEKLGVEAALVAPLTAYVGLIERWNATHNLVRYRTREELVRRHVLESLAGAARLPERHGVLADVGSGAGFPGIPLLIARPAWRGVLVEPRRKRWAFLRLVIRELGLDAEAVACRYDELEPAGFDVVVSRALGGHEALLRWARGRLHTGGRVLLWTTEERVSSLGRSREWRVVSWPLPGLDTGRLAEFQPCFT